MRLAESELMKGDNAKDVEMAMEYAHDLMIGVDPDTRMSFL